MTTGSAVFLTCFFGFCVAMIVYDVWLAKRYGVADQSQTISRGMWNLGREYPILAFFLGMVVGGLAVHFFAP